MPQLPQPTQLRVEQSAIDDLMARLQRTRWSPEIGNSRWEYGANGAFLKDLVEYWQRGFDWRKQEAEINRYAHFRLDVIDGVPIHFIRESGKGPAPMPLILTHGWPWTFWDWHQLIGPLTDPARYGGDPADAFDVIVPSLPGYGLSIPLSRAGITATAVAELWHKLMHDILGYERFSAAGGDWGSFITWELGRRYATTMTGVYLSTPPLWYAGGVENLRSEDYSASEAGWLEKTRRKWQTVVSHLTVHSRDHQTLAWALNDSPIGLAAWLLERRRSWSDCNGDLYSRYTRDFLLTNICLYWFTQSIASSMQLYAEEFRTGAIAGDSFVGSTPPARIEVPTGIGVYPEEIALLPRKMCERAANLVHWSVLPEGGHFAPAEVPEIYVRELRTFFRSLR
jgi:pimeloyl-ACP methyl ester carboxylesterase